MKIGGGGGPRHQQPNKKKTITHGEGVFFLRTCYGVTPLRSFKGPPVDIVKANSGHTTHCKPHAASINTTYNSEVQKMDNIFAQIVFF